MDLTRIRASLKSYENGSSVTNKNYLFWQMALGIPPRQLCRTYPCTVLGFPGGRGCRWGEHRAPCSFPQLSPATGLLPPPHTRSGQREGESGQQHHDQSWTPWQPLG